MHTKWILFLHLLHFCVGYNILIPLPFTFRSTNNLMITIANRLAEHGHLITFLSPYPMSKSHPKVTHIMLPSSMRAYDAVDPFEIRRTNYNPYYEPDQFFNRTKIFINHSLVEEIWRKRHQFDAILTDAYFQEMILHFLIGFKGAFLFVGTTGFEGSALGIMGNEPEHSIFPAFIFTSDFDHTKFWHRLLNFLYVQCDYKCFMKSTITEVHDIIKEKYPQLQTYDYYLKKLDLVLLNGHYLTNTNVPLLPNQIPIGCVNCVAQNNLQEDIRKLLDDANEIGVIYFSLGTLANNIPKDYLTIILEALGKLPHKVIMKLNSESNLPPNIITRKWLSQQDILAHKNTKLFITHCGMQSVHEARYHGVPMLALPIVIDQLRNAQDAEDAGIAKVVQWEEMSIESLYETISSILNDSKYMERAQTISRLFQDQITTPSERLVWWTEYAIRNVKDSKVFFRGKEIHALHYRGQDLSRLQYWGVDVVVFLTIVCIVTICLLYFLLRKILFYLTTLFKKGTQKDKKYKSS